MTPTTNPNQPHHHHHHQSSRVFYELSSLLLSILRSPNFSDQHSAITSSSLNSSMTSSTGVRRRVGTMTTGGLASLMLGISLALMLCGSVTFLIGFMLLPWVIGLVLVFYFVGLVSSLSVLGRALVCFVSAPPNLDHHHPSPPSPKDIPAWKFL